MSLDVRLRSDGPVLVLRALGLGDLLTGVPALRGLRRLVAPRPVLLAAPEPVARWLVDLDVVDGVVPTASLADAPPGHGLGDHDAVDLHGNGLPSRDLLAAGRPRSLLAWAQPGEPGPVWRGDEHEVARWCRLVSASGAECDVDDVRLPRPSAERRHGRVVLHPGAASGSRRWPPERWARVAAELARSGREVVVTAGPAERTLAERVAAGADGAQITVAHGLGLPDLAALLASADLLVCGDTGVAHLATAMAVPSVLLFGPISPNAWGPAIDPALHAVLWHGDGSGDPHGATVDPSLLLVTVDEVLQAARYLAAGGHSQAAARAPW